MACDRFNKSIDLITFAYRQPLSLPTGHKREFLACATRSKSVLVNTVGLKLADPSAVDWYILHRKTINPSHITSIIYYSYQNYFGFLNIKIKGVKSTLDLFEVYK